MLGSVKKEFGRNYPGLINALKNTFINLEIKTPWFLSSNSDVYLSSNLNLNGNQLNMNFYISKNNNKFDYIKYEIDYDYFINNKTNSNSKTFNLNSKIEFFDIGNKYDYINYINHMGLKNHLLSKYKGGDLNTTNLFMSGSQNYYEEIKIIANQQKKALENNGSIYDALGRPQGVKKHSTFWFMNNQRSVNYNGNEITSFDYENADLLDGYKHKSNFVLHIEIKDKNSVLYESYILLDTSNMKEVKLTDYDNVKNNIDSFLVNFEQIPIHEILSKNFNTISLVREFTGKTFLKKHNQKIGNNSSVNLFNQLSSDEVLLLVNDFMAEKFHTEMLVFESTGFSLINGNYISPNDVMLFATQMKQTQNILKNCLTDFLDMSISEDTKLLLSKSWDILISEALRSEVAKFQIRNNVKLLDKR